MGVKRGSVCILRAACFWRQERRATRATGDKGVERGSSSGASATYSVAAFFNIAAPSCLPCLLNLEPVLPLSQFVKPSQLPRELRQGQAPELRARRNIVALSLVGVAMAQIVSLYQIGIVKHLPDPPLDVFDSDKVDASDYAYKRFLTADGFLMLMLYGTTAWLAATGGEKRSEERPYLSLLMGAKILLDLVSAAELAREEWNDNKKLCPYCQTATLASLASLVLAWPELKRAWQSWRRG